MNMEQEIIKAATNMATTAANKGIGKLTDLVFSKQILQQKRLETLSTTQDQKDAELIQNGLAEFRDGKFLIIEDQIGNPSSPLGLILAQNHQNQSKNLTKCLSKAYKHLSKKADKKISDEQISETFFNKWMNYGKEVSEEELQDLWGRILGEEITTPSSINYLVLNTFSLMSKKHLEAFIDLLPFICDGKLYCNNALSAEENYSYVPPSILSELIDLNIIKGLHPGVFFSKKNYIKSLMVITFTKLNLISFLLTTIGQKLFEIALGNFEIENYFLKLINSFKQLPEFNSIQAFELVSFIDNKWQSKLIIQR